MNVRTDRAGPQPAPKRGTWHVALALAFAGAGPFAAFASDADRRDDASPSVAAEDAAGGGASRSTEQGRTPLARSFGNVPGTRRRHPLRETTFHAESRAFSFDRDRGDDTESAALALGGAAGIVTGHFGGRVALGATAFASLPVDAPPGSDGTGLLRPGQRGYETMGELYAEVLLSPALHAHLGRKQYETPYINGNDSRMSPNTFEAYSLVGSTPDPARAAQWRYGIAYFDAIKPRNEEEFVPMSRAAGAMVDRGVHVAGAHYADKGFSLGAIGYYSRDIVRIGYVEASWLFPLGERSDLRLSGQFTRQASTGGELLTGAPFSARQYGIKGDLALGNLLLTAAWTSTGGGASMLSPWSGYPGYTSVQIEDFNRAGEDARMARVEYEFRAWPGFSAYATWVDGSDPLAPDAYARRERDVNLQWRAPGGRLHGLTLRVRYAETDDPGDPRGNARELRLIAYFEPTR